MKSSIEVEGKTNYAKMEFRFKKTSLDITSAKNIHVPIEKKLPFDFKMSMKPASCTDGSVMMKMKSTRNDCLLQTLRVEIVIVVRMKYFKY